MWLSCVSDMSSRVTYIDVSSFYTLAWTSLVHVSCHLTATSPFAAEKFAFTLYWDFLLRLVGFKLLKKVGYFYITYAKSWVP